MLVETAESDLVRQYSGDAQPTEGGALSEKLVGASANSVVLAPSGGAETYASSERVLDSSRGTGWVGLVSQ